MNEKQERFIRVAERRTQKILDDLKALSKCSRPACYEFDEQDVEKIFRAIEEGVQKTKDAFAGKNRFSLSSKVLDMKQACLELPTADVVEVVRCKDCIKRNTPDCAIWNHCVICGDQWTLNVKNDFYCARGAKMNEEKKAGVDNG